MDRERIIQLTKEYNEADIEYKGILTEIFGSHWKNDFIGKNIKVFGKKELSKLLKVEARRDAARKVWFGEISKR